MSFLESIESKPLPSRDRFPSLDVQGVRNSFCSIVNNDGDKLQACVAVRDDLLDKQKDLG